MNWLINTVKGKLFFVVGLLSTVAIIVGALSLSKMGDINDRLNEIVDVTSTKQLLAARTRQALIAMHRAEKNLILSQNPKEMDAFAASFDEYSQMLHENIEKMVPLATEENKRLIDEFMTQVTRFEDVNKEIRVNSRKNTNGQAFDLSSTRGRELFDQIDQALTSMADRNDREVTALIEEARAATEDAMIRQKLGEADNAATRALLTARMRADMIAMQRAEKNFILARSKQDMEHYAKIMAECETSVQQYIDQIHELATDENKAVLASFVDLRDQWVDNNKKVQELSLEASNRVAQDLSNNQAREFLDNAELKLREISEMADEAMLTAAQASDENYAAARILVIVTIVLGVLIGLAVAWYIVNGIVRSINVVMGRAREIADGDLTGEALVVRSKDEIGQLTECVNEMSRSLNEVVGEVGSASREVAGAATEIAASSEEMATSMNEQSAQITQVSSAIEEMSASVVEVARKSAEAAENANQSGQVATEGGEVVKETITGMNAIAEAVKSGAASVEELGKRGDQIGQIIEVINDIADQTNLLALNAAIEAARAGEHGRGFAVVADEVRKLADRTTKATEEIAQSIQAIQKETGEAVQRMNAGTTEVESGVEKATGAGRSLEQIVSSAQEVASMIQSIAAAAEEQSAASEQVSRNIESISAATRQASEGTAQSAAAATQLSSKSEQLLALVGKFKVRSEGQRPQSDPAATAGKVGEPQPLQSAA